MAERGIQQREIPALFTKSCTREREERRSFGDHGRLIVCVRTCQFLAVHITIDSLLPGYSSHGC